jgi:hypothetical protein
MNLTIYVGTMDNQGKPFQVGAKQLFYTLKINFDIQAALVIRGLAIRGFDYPWVSN